MSRDAAAMARETDDPLLGRVLARRYLLLSLIDRGGMGRVYRAKRVSDGKRVAIKALDLSDPMGEYRRRFEAEAHIQGKLHHPNTVRIFDHGRTEDGLYYIAMELLEGVSLDAVIKAHAPLPPRRVVRIARQICAAMHEAHEIGVVHRDLKPANVFLIDGPSGADHVKILDFGLVKNLESNQDLSHTGQTLGSPLYMTPEQVEGFPVDRRTDVYALGLVIWVAITGRHPFPKGSIPTVMMHQVSTPVLELSVVQPGVPRRFSELVSHCVAKPKHARPPSMVAVERELAAIAREMDGLAPLPTSAEPSESFSLLPPERSRGCRPYLLPALALGVVLLLLLFAALLLVAALVWMWLP